LLYNKSTTNRISGVSALLVSAARRRRTADCVALAILIGMYQLVNDIRARRSNACVRLYLQN